MQKFLALALALLFPLPVCAQVSGVPLSQGSWTPNVGGTATYIAQAGRYTKIGRSVCVTGRMEINAIGTGNVTTVSGLPFVAAGAHAALAVHVTVAATAIVSIVGVVSPGGNTVVMWSRVAASANDSPATTIFGSGSILYLSGCYST